MKSPRLPVRGFVVLIEALPELLRRRPSAHFVAEPHQSRLREECEMADIMAPSHARTMRIIGKWHKFRIPSVELGARSVPMPTEKARQDLDSGAAQRSLTEALSSFLSSDRYPLHSRLPPERTLCSLLSVSRTALRQGLDALESEGRIWRHVGKGTFVGGRPQSVHSRPEALAGGTTLTELLETRMLIEPQAARLAALRAEPSDLALIGRYQSCAAGAQDWATWDYWDELFHRSVAEASGNGLMISIVDQILRVKKRTPWTITRAKTFDPKLRDHYAAEHAAIVAAIKAHDLEGAEKSMAQHIDRISCSIGPITSRAWHRRAG